jgi:DNA repair exonuclease SbcCD ATPase subunit
MSVQPLSMCAILVSNQGMQEEINKLKSQMQGLQPGSPEYEFDQLQLQREQLEQQIRQENPSLDPQTLAGNEALEQLIAQDPHYQAIQGEIEALTRAYPSEATSWGIPMASSQDVKVVVIN